MASQAKCGFRWGVREARYPHVALTDARIRTTKLRPKPTRLPDGARLYLEVRPTGTKLWRYRYRIAGKEDLFAVGEYPEVSLADARSERDKVRALVKQGIHPSHSRQTDRLVTLASNANTFEAVTQEWIAKNACSWTPYYRKQVDSFLGGDVFPYVCNLPIRNVTSAHLLEIVRRIEGRGAATVALLVRQWCSAIFRHAVATLRADGNPAAALRGAIHRPRVEHRRPLSKKEIGEFLLALDGYAGYRTTVIALRLMLLTFVRTVELRMARWEEFDLDAAEWRIPAVRMKMRQEHIVPLSDQAVALLREL